MPIAYTTENIYFIFVHFLYSYTISALHNNMYNVSQYLL